MKKSILTLLCTLSLTLLMCTTSFAKEPTYYPDGDVNYHLSSRDSLETYLKTFREYSIIDPKYTKNNTICFTTNEYLFQFGKPLKQTNIYFYKGNPAKISYEFQNPQDKKEILEECKLRYERSFTHPQYNKNSSSDSFYYEEYSWETLNNHIILYYSNQPGIGERLIFSIINKYAIDDKNYFNSDFDKKYFTI